MADVIVVGSLIWTGHCQCPDTKNPESSHARCTGVMFTPSTGKTHICPCAHHLGTEDFDCSGCGYLIREAPHLGPDEDGDPQYAHVDEDGNIYSIECPS